MLRLRSAQTPSAVPTKNGVGIGWDFLSGWPMTLKKKNARNNSDAPNKQTVNENCSNIKINYVAAVMAVSSSPVSSLMRYFLKRKWILIFKAIQAKMK